MVFESILPLKRLKEIDDEEINVKHIAIDVSEISFLETLNKNNSEESLQAIENNLIKRNELLKSIIDLQINYKIPIVTLYLSRKEDKPIFESKIYEKINELFNELDEIIVKNSIRLTAMGKWYDIPTNTTDYLRTLVEKTKDNESFFLNLCINYSGREEIIDSCKIMAHKVKSGKLEPNNITNEEFRNNIYASKFSQPDKIIILNKKRKLSGFLLWDSSESLIYFLEKNWNEITMKELEKFFA